MIDVGFLDASDPRMVSTMNQLEASFARGPHMLRYEAADDFGVPGNGFQYMLFLAIEALARMGRVGEAREHFEALLALRNRLGLMSEDVDLQTGELWGLSTNLFNGWDHQLRGAIVVFLGESDMRRLVIVFPIVSLIQDAARLRAGWRLAFSTHCARTAGCGSAGMATLLPMRPKSPRRLSNTTAAPS